MEGNVQGASFAGPGARLCRAPPPPPGGGIVKILMLYGVEVVVERYLVEGDVEYYYGYILWIIGGRGCGIILCII